MTVYVDNMHRPHRPLHNPGAVYVMSHMMADSVAELHAMADHIGVDRRWFQDQPDHPHYDISTARRRRAVAAGAQEITQKEMAAFAWHLRTFGAPIEPWFALEKWRDARRGNKHFEAAE